MQLMPGNQASREGDAGFLCVGAHACVRVGTGTLVCLCVPACLHKRPRQQPCQRRQEGQAEVTSPAHSSGQARPPS